MAGAGTSSPNPTHDFDVVIIGAGFAGMYMLHRARGLGLSARVYEAADGVGGTWYWNRYPGEGIRGIRAHPRLSRGPYVVVVVRCGGRRSTTTVSTSSTV
jgi:cation diffusion facilitator CzcD-associated flavoprotein CzcO